MIEDLARRFGTPLFVYDLDELARSVSGLRSVLPAGSELFYAVKANPHPAVLRMLAALGVSFDVSSGQEAVAAVAAGARPEALMFTGPGKTDADLHAALDQGTRRFSAESERDARNIGAAAQRHGTEAECYLRLAVPLVGRAGLRFNRSGSFGMSVETVVDALADLKRVPGIRVNGAHCFSVSNIADETALLDSVRTAAEAATAVADAGLDLKFVSLGGGFAAAYGRPAARPRYEEIADPLADIVASLHGRFPAVLVGFESGRNIAASCGRYVARVSEVRLATGTASILLDGGIHHLGGQVMVGQNVFREACRPEFRSAEPVAETRTVSIRGPLCTPADLLARNLQLDELPVEGSLAVFPNAGAYGLTASPLAFLDRISPAEVVLRDQRVIEVTRRETSYVHLPLDHRAGP